MRKLSLALVLIGALASPAVAGTIKVLQGPYQSGRGGEFTYQVLSGPEFNTSGYASATRDQGSPPVVPSFQTFCIERDEFLGYGKTYTATLSNAAQRGGQNTDSGDPVSRGTGWLYSQFARGTLSGYYYSASNDGGNKFTSRNAAADALQNTIWWLEGEADSGGGTNHFGTLVTAYFAGLGLDKFDGSAAEYGVKAINMNATSCPQTEPYCQDGLFYVPDSGTTVAFLGLALMGLGAIRRKMTQ